MDSLISKPTAEQEFMFMLYERIVALETLVDQQNLKIEKQQADIEKLKKNQLPIRYNISLNEFSDKSRIEWNIKLPIEEAKIVFSDCGRKIPITDLYLDAYITVDDEDVFNGKEVIIIQVPIERGGPGVFEISFILSEMTVRKVMKTIRDFYLGEVTEEQLESIEQAVYGNSMDYNMDIFWNMFNKNKGITWMEMMCRDVKCTELLFMGTENQLDLAFEIYIC